MYAIVSFGPCQPGCSSPSSVQPLPQPGYSAFRCRTTPRVHMLGPIRHSTSVPTSKRIALPSSLSSTRRTKSGSSLCAGTTDPSVKVTLYAKESPLFSSPRLRTTPRFHPSVYGGWKDSCPMATSTSSPTAILCGGGGVTGLPLTILCIVYGPVNPCMSRIICIANCTAGTELSPAAPSVKLLPLSMSSKTCTPSLSLYTSRYVAPPGDIASAAHCFLCVFQSFFWHSLQQ
mmetsp:Transcript_525/g.2434  ORF Transcript_525/g.2434 Transcript_525/m.2434 type:complete len:231 (+) Transcript_525:185-877(+)